MATIIQFPVKVKTGATQNRERIVEILGADAGGKLLASVDRERAKRSAQQIAIAKPGPASELAFDNLSNALLAKVRRSHSGHTRRETDQALVHALIEMRKGHDQEG